MATPMTLADLKLVIEMSGLNADVAERLEATIVALQEAQEEAEFQRSEANRLRDIRTVLMTELEEAKAELKKSQNY